MLTLVAAFRKFGLLVVCDVRAALFGNMAGWDMTRQRGRENMSLVLEGSLCGGRSDLRKKVVQKVSLTISSIIFHVYSTDIVQRHFRSVDIVQNIQRTTRHRAEWEGMAFRLIAVTWSLTFHSTACKRCAIDILDAHRSIHTQSVSKLQCSRNLTSMYMGWKCRK